LRRGQSYALREKLDGIVRDPRATTPIADPARARLLEARRAIVEGWNTIASKLEAQGETVVGGHVRYFATHLPPVLTDRERLLFSMLNKIDYPGRRIIPATEPKFDRHLEKSR